MNFYEHHLGDYLRDTAHLTVLEDGAYRRLLDAYYLRESALPADVGQVCRLVRAGSKAERAAVASILGEFFIQQEDGWYHKRCEAEIQKVRNRSAAARQNGLASAEAKRQRKLNGRSTGVERSSQQNSTSQSPVPSPQSEGASKSRRPAKPGSRRAPEGFQPDLDFARREVPGIDAEAEAAKFRDFEFAKPRSDWDATWRNWVRTARDTGRYARLAAAPGAIQWQ